MTLNSVKSNIKSNIKEKLKLIKEKLKGTGFFTEKNHVIFMIVLWFLGMIVGFTPLAAGLQGLLWAWPVGWWTGVSIAKLTMGMYD